MTQEEKYLLLVDLCARLPYKPRVRYYYCSIGSVAINGYTDEGYLSYQNLEDFSLYPKYGLEKTRVYNISPYLRPMSNMTEEELKDLLAYSGLREHEIEICKYDGGAELEFWLNEVPCAYVGKVIDWLNKNMFDYRGLIPMGLALEAPEGMYN